MQKRLIKLKRKNKMYFKTHIPIIFLILILLNVYLIDKTSLSVKITSIKIFFTMQAISV